MTKTTREAIIENVQPFKRGVVSFYMSQESKAKLDRMAEELTHTNSGRGVTMDAMIEFTNANYVNFKAWYENREVKSNATLKRDD